ncbi:dynamin family protein [Salinicoccus roseus]|uniref:dynamin family protein n=1 Tax=Salinicoccus roseus TaxID=45670 RepID=UPI0022FFC712|nr:dynamin family protein [Salinicoccus roseus]
MITRQADSSNQRLKSLITRKNRIAQKKRMKHDFHSIEREIYKTYNEINSELDNDYAILLHPILNELTALSFKMKELTEGLDKTFELFIVGMGNYGKSTLINALLGQEVADIDVRPKTWKVDVFDATLSNEECVIVYRNGETEYRSVEETRVFLEKEEEKIKNSRKVVKSELKKVLNELKTKEAIQETEDYLKKEFLYQSNVVEVRWPINANHLSKKFMVVDTPGLVQENLSGDAIISVQKYYHKADGVIWMLDATKLASKKSKDMVDELEASLSKIGGKTDNIIAVLNRIDLVRKNGGEEAEQKVIDEANKVFGKHFDNFICISAKQALKGIINKDSQQISESGIDNLIETINSTFYENAQKIQIQSRGISYKQIIHDVTQDSHLIKAYVNRLREEQYLYTKRKKMLLKKFKEARKGYKNELDDITVSFLQGAQSRIENHASVLFDLESENERGKYIKDHLLSLEELQPGLEKMHKYWLNEIENLMRQLVTEVVFTEYKHIDPNTLKKLFKETDKVPRNVFSYKLNSANLETEDISFASGAGFAAIGGLIFGPIGLLLAGLTSFLGINKEIAKLFKSGELKRELNEAINTHVEDVRKSILNDIDLKKEKATKNVLKNFNQSYENLHGTYKSSVKNEEYLTKLYETFEKPIIYPDIKTLLINDKRKMNDEV